LLVVHKGNELALAAADEGGATITRWGKLKGIEFTTRYAMEVSRTKVSWALRRPKFPRDGELVIEGPRVEDLENDPAAAAIAALAG
jgi:hypothetical protein